MQMMSKDNALYLWKGLVVFKTADHYSSLAATPFWFSFFMGQRHFIGGSSYKRRLLKRC